MKHLLIIGARGLGREFCAYAEDFVGYGEEFVIKGFLDDKKDALDGKPGYPPILDSVENYEIQEDDVFICALGDTKYKKHYTEIIQSKGGKFINLIHNTAHIGKNTNLGEGTVVLKYASIGSDVKMGNSCFIQDFAIIGHDCKIGDYVRIDTHCTCVGGIVLREGAMIYTSSVVNQGVTVGEYAVVGALSFVIRNVKPGTTVSGNPAKKVEF